MAFDFKKEYRAFYLPKNKPGIIEIPRMNYLAVTGKGDPNAENGEYKQSINLLYTIAYTIKMSDRTAHKIAGFFAYVVPPLEGLWWQDQAKVIDYQHKENFHFRSMIRLPDFVTPADVDWAVKEAARKKQQDFSQVTFFTYDEGICVQCMHIGSYDDEPATIQLMDDYAKKNGYDLDITAARRHHEIYLSDPRKAKTENLKTVIRHPLKKSMNHSVKNRKQKSTAAVIISSYRCAFGLLSAYKYCRKPIYPGNKRHRPVPPQCGSADCISQCDPCGTSSRF